MDLREHELEKSLSEIIRRTAFTDCARQVCTRHSILDLQFWLREGAILLRGACHGVQAGLANAANRTKPATIALVIIRATVKNTEALLGPPSVLEDVAPSSELSVCVIEVPCSFSGSSSL
jgi:hypothetical protein